MKWTFYQNFFFVQTDKTSVISPRTASLFTIHVLQYKDLHVKNNQNLNYLSSLEASSLKTWSDTKGCYNQNKNSLCHMRRILKIAEIFPPYFAKIPSWKDTCSQTASLKRCVIKFLNSEFFRFLSKGNELKIQLYSGVFCSCIYGKQMSYYRCYSAAAVFTHR